jgi:serine protease Do
MRSTKISAPGVSELLASELAALAERLRRSTVQVRAGRTGAGSGLILRADGLIVTNAHVARSRRLSVVLADGRPLPASIVAVEPQRDLAALSVEASALPAAPIGDSDALRVGELVFAVGNPLGLVGAVSTGIVHAVEALHGTRGDDWVRADVRLLPGNSGGPLADVQGRVVGINSMVVGGLAFAVPSNTVKRFLNDLGERAYLGITTQPGGKGARAA